LLNFMNHSFPLPPSNSLEQNVKLLAEHYNSIIQPGHGLFFDLSATPELEKPILEYLSSVYGWTLEKPYFIRKPLHHTTADNTLPQKPEVSYADFLNSTTKHNIPMENNPDPSSPVDRMKMLIDFFNDEIGLPYDKSPVDLLIEAKSNPNPKPKEQFFNECKTSLIQKQFLIPVMALHNQGLPIYIFNNLAKKEDRHELLHKLFMIQFSALAAAKQIKVVSVNDAILQDVLKKENLYPYDKGLFIFTDDFNTMAHELKTKLIEVDMQLLLNSLKDALINKSN
jgi:hypothetical protein